MRRQILEQPPYRGGSAMLACNGDRVCQHLLTIPRLNRKPFFTRRLLVIIGAMQVHAEELATPQGAGQLIGGVLGKLASEDASRRDSIRQMVVEARVIAAESGLLITEPVDEGEVELWQKSRREFNKKLTEELMPLVDTDRVSVMEEVLSGQSVLIDLQEAVARIIPEP